MRNFKGTWPCLFVEMLKRHLVRERLGTSALQWSDFGKKHGGRFLK